jgi:hypothetical protein
MSIARNLSKLAAFLSSAGQTQAAGIADGAVTYAKLSSDVQGDMNQFKNRIINGAMMIDQRNAGASVTPTDGSYTLDRWSAKVTQASKFTVQQVSDAPAGFVNSLKATSSSAYSVISSDWFYVQQIIEGFNSQDLAWGTASASAVTLSFWVKSSLTGTFGGALFSGGGGNASYPYTYTINSANTWEQKTIQVPAATIGTWLTGNSGNIWVTWGLGIGSSNTAAAGSWTSSLVRGANGCVSVVGTNGATFYITGVQLEKGSTATSFDYRPYGAELALCQRYYRNGILLTATGTGTVSYLRASSLMPVTMRATPTFVLTDNAGNVNKVSGDSANNIPGSVGGGANYVYIQSEAYTIGTNVFMSGNVTASAEL